ncbi:hypothetical protein GCM10011418_10870 [Sphingobacterium alkalisoli]|nr:hypothetical protein GCM10011418_10870 [Sphingobacterium alkalisoli]
MVFSAELQDNAIGEGVNEGVNLLLSIIKSAPGKRAPFYSKELGISVKTIERWIKSLRSDDKIEFRGAPKTGGYWVIK